MDEASGFNGEADADAIEAFWGGTIEPFWS